MSTRVIVQIVLRSCARPPNTWNISPTYDRGRLSMRGGMAYNGANIFAYDFVQPPGTVTPGGIKGPSGDQYLFSHFQVDAQGSYYLGKGLTAMASGLTLNNEAFGFYQGSPQFFIQREHYKPTYSLGLRWELAREMMRVRSTDHACQPVIGRTVTTLRFRSSSHGLSELLSCFTLHASEAIAFLRRNVSWHALIPLVGIRATLAIARTPICAESISF